ncbi:MAG: NADH-quinone oxidoreductase subunit H [Acetobacteraceae bacterium]
MGVAEDVGFVLIALLGGALLTAGLERLLGTAERGAARPLAMAPATALANADRWLLPAGPIAGLTGVLLGTVVVPFGPILIGRDLGIGVFYFIVVIDFVVLGVALNGWGANTADAVESCYRIVAQLVSYIVPLGLAYVGAIMMARSLSTTAIVDAQSGLWFIALQPLGFALYVVSGLMQSYRAPVLEAFADRIGGGMLGVAGGGPGLIWRVSLSGLLFLVAAMGAILFLGGWSGPFLPPPVWMAAKTYALMALMLWLGRLVRPLSTAGMLALSWKILIPVGLVNVLIVGILILLHIGPA